MKPLTEQRSHARAGCAGRVSGAAASVTGVVRGAPLTLTFASVLWLLGAFTGSLLRGPTPGLLAAIGVGPGALVRNHWWTAVGSVFWCADLGGYLAATVLLLALVAPAERRLGSGRTALLLIAAQVAGTVIGSALVELGSSAGDGWAVYLAGNLVLGPGAAAVGVAMAFTCRMSALWRRRIRLVLLLSSVLLVGYSGSLSDVYRLVAAVTGLLIGPLLLGRPRRSGPMASTRTERRVLIALTVATLALGPVIAAVSKTPIGPLSVLRYLILIPPPTADTVHQVCANPTTREDCRALRAQLTLSGVGPTIMTMLPVLLLLVTADGLRRGRRAAWWAAPPHPNPPHPNPPHPNPPRASRSRALTNPPGPEHLKERHPAADVPRVLEMEPSSPCRIIVTPRRPVIRSPSRWAQVSGPHPIRGPIRGPVSVNAQVRVGPFASGTP